MLKQLLHDIRSRMRSAIAAQPRQRIHADWTRRRPDGVIEIKGWLVSQDAIDAAWVILGGARYDLMLGKRSDVNSAMPSYRYAAGFSGTVTAGASEGAPTLQIRYRTGAREGGKTFPITSGGSEPRPMSPEAKQSKLDRIAPHLICPECRAPLDLIRMTCTRNGHSYGRTAMAFDFFSEDFKREFGVIDTENVSANGYDPITLDLIEKYREGLVLDCGAGRRDIDFPNVVNYEIVAYPSTDVLGVGERLPFADGTFDGALSLNVLEHVAEPFRCAAELARVVKRGGRLYCVVPFLQPVHGYPNHFYNMTSQGLRHLFEREFEIVERDVPLSGVPIWTLTWMLRSWSDGLSGRARSEFLDLRVKDLLGDPLEYLERNFVRELGRERNFELASTTMIVATRK